MSNQNSNHVEKRKGNVVNSALDTGEQTLSKWMNNYIEENLPQAMNWTVEKIKDYLRDIKLKEHCKISDSTRKCIATGLEIGEDNQQRAYIMAMREYGLEDNQITDIVGKSKKHIVKFDDYFNSKNS